MEENDELKPNLLKSKCKQLRVYIPLVSRFMHKVIQVTTQ